MPRAPAENRSLIGTEGIAIGILRRLRLARLRATTTATGMTTTLLVNNICFLAYERSYDRGTLHREKGNGAGAKDKRMQRIDEDRDEAEERRVANRRRFTKHRRHHHHGFLPRKGEGERNTLGDETETKKYALRCDDLSRRHIVDRDAYGFPARRVNTDG